MTSRQAAFQIRAVCTSSLDLSSFILRVRYMLLDMLSIYRIYSLLVVMQGGTIHPAADIVSRSPGLAVRETTLKDGVFSTP